MTSKAEQEREVLYKKEIEAVHEAVIAMQSENCPPYVFVNYARRAYRQAYEKIIRRYQ